MCGRSGFPHPHSLPLPPLCRCQNARGDNRNGRHKLRGEQGKKGKKEGSILILAGGGGNMHFAAAATLFLLGLPAAIASIRAAGGRPRAAWEGSNSFSEAEASARLGLDVGVIWGWLCIGFASQQRLTTSSIRLQGGFMRIEVAHSRRAI